MVDPNGYERPRRRIWRVSWVTRILAPLALIVVLGALYVIVRQSSDDGGGKSDSVKTRTSDNGKDGKKKDKSDGEKAPKTYTIKSGDSLSLIAEKFHTTVDDLLRLNADANIDPEALVAGQELKIR